jgi:hypothetical protein
VIVDTPGGAVDVDPAGTGFPWRKQSAVAQWYVETSGQTSTAAQLVSTAHQAVQPYSVGGNVNYLEANTSAARYFGSNLSRLTSVRQKYDPNRVMFSGLDFQPKTLQMFRVGVGAEICRDFRMGSAP